MSKSLSVIDYQRSFSRTAELAYSLFTIFVGWCFGANSSIFAFEIWRDAGSKKEHIKLDLVDINRSCLGVSFLATTSKTLLTKLWTRNDRITTGLVNSRK